MVVFYTLLNLDPEAIIVPSNPGPTNSIHFTFALCPDNVCLRVLGSTKQWKSDINLIKNGCK